MNGMPLSDPSAAERPPIHRTTGKARIVRALYHGTDLRPAWAALSARAEADQADAGAFLDLSLILQGMSRFEESQTFLRAALETSRVFLIDNGHPAPDQPTVLVFVTAGDFMANTPVEFLLENAGINIVLRYVDEHVETLDDVPDHDLAFVAIGHSQANIRILDRLEPLLAGWPRPIVNRALGRIAELSRDGVADKLDGAAEILAPRAFRLARARLAELAGGAIPVEALFDGAAFPIIARPPDTHAGMGMEKIASVEELAAYLRKVESERFFVSPFIDYANADGKFRKQRIAFIDGRAYPSHLAISDHWMVHYLSAGMTEYAARRDEEARWMQTFDTDFAVRHAEAFRLLHERIGLDYFAIDCSEMPDGRLLLFEADNAMIVHSLDPVEIFPYKEKPMQRLFSAFETALLARIR